MPVQGQLRSGGANASALFEASRTCGAVGEWKRRVAEELSAVYFVGGWEAAGGSWVMGWHHGISMGFRARSESRVAV